MPWDYTIARKCWAFCRFAIPHQVGLRTHWGIVPKNSSGVWGKMPTGARAAALAHRMPRLFSSTENTLPALRQMHSTLILGDKIH
jgi:hypothetical protein